MKRYFKTITAVVLAALTTAACQKENFGDATPAGQEVDVTLDLLAPQIGTKSYGGGTTAKTVYVHVYQQDDKGGLTYIQPAAEGASLKTPSQSLTLDGLKATYSTRLVTGQTYTFVFWAQADKAPYTYDTDAKTITVNYASAKGNDESRDAFYNVLPNVKIEGAYTASVQLARPFAQLNFGVTSEDYAAAKAAGLTVTKAMVKLTHAATSLNLLDGTTTGDKTVTFASAALPADPNDILKAGGKDYKYVAMDYVLVGKSAKTLSDVTLTLTATGTHSATPRFTYSNVPLQANYRTNIVGNLFTSPAEVQIEITPGFGTPDNDVVVENVSSIAAANTAFANGATAVNVTNILSSEKTDIVLPKTTNGVSLTLPAVPSGKTVTIKYADGASEGHKPQTLTVNAKSADAITIEAPNTHVELNGGTVVNTVTASTSSTTLVVGKDVKIGTLTLEQGAAEIYGNVSKVVKGENAGTVTWYVDDAANFETALNNADKVVLTANIDLVKTASLKSGRTVVLDANGKTIKNTSTGIAIMANGDLTIDGDGNVDGGKGGNNQAVHVMPGAKVTINGGNFSVGPDASGFGNSCIETSGGDIVINGGHFESEAAYHGWYYVLNQNNSTPGTITVTGGTFVNYDPSTGDDYLGGNFVADGYASVTASTNPLTYKVGPVENPGEDGEALAEKLTNTSGKVYEIASELSINTSVVSERTDTLYISKTGSVIPSESFRKEVSESFFVGAGTLTFDGQGTIQGPSGSTYGNGSQAILVQGGKINIYGNLTIDGGSGSEANRALKITNGTANIYSGYFHAGLDKYGRSSEVIFLHPAYRKYAYCNIYGGVFETEGGPAHLLNIKDKERARATFKVYGGTFVGFNPADNTAEGDHTNFVAEGYKSVATKYNGKDAWTVVAE